MKPLAMILFLMTQTLGAAAPAPSPVALSPTGVSQQLRFSWAAVTAPAGITAYQVYYATFADVTNATATYATNTALVASGFNDGEPGWFAVQADVTYGALVSLTVSAIPYAPADAPALTVTALSFGKGIQLTWNQPVTHGYSVGAYRVEVSGSAAVARTVAASVNQTTVAWPCASGVTLQVRALDVLGHTGTASAAQLTSFPCAPSAYAVSITQAADSLTLGWIDPLPYAPIASYAVYYATVAGLTDGDPALSLDVTAAAGTLGVTMTASAANPGESRWYRVYSIYPGAVTSAASTEVALLAPPPAPSAGATHAKVVLSWAMPGAPTDSGLTGYQVYYSTYLPLLPVTPITYTQMVNGTNTGATVHVTVTAGLADGGRYYFALSALGGGHEGSLGLTASARIGLASPAITRFNQVQGGIVNLAWTAVDVTPNAVVGYSVYAATDAWGSAATLQASVTWTATATYLTPPARPLSYWFVAVSDSAANVSDLSPSGSLLFAPQLDAPVVSTGTAANGRVVLTWTAVADALDYQVYRATQSVNPPFTGVSFTTKDAWDFSGTSFVDTRPANGQDNLYRVLSRRTLGLASSKLESPLSVTVSAGPTVPPGIPGAYTIYNPAAPNTTGAYLTASARPTLDGVDLQWAPAPMGSWLLSGYKVYMGRSVAALTQVGFVAASAETYTSKTSTYSASVQDPSSLFFAVEAEDVSGTVGPRLTGQPLAYAAWPAPQSPTATNVGSAVYLNWSPALGHGSYPLAGYRVLRRLAKGSLDTDVTASAVTSTSFIDAAARSLSSSVLTYSIAAVDSLGYAGALTRVGATFGAPTPSGALPLSPTAVTAKTLTGTAVPALIQWEPNREADQVTNYAVYRDGLPLALTLTTAYLDYSTTTGASHAYLVQALNASGAGVSGTTQPASLSIAPPFPLSVSASYSVDPAGSTTLAQRISWTDLSYPAGVDGYVVYRQPGGASAPTTSTSFADTGVTPGGPAYYRVVSQVLGFESANAPVQLTLTVAAAPVAPTVSPMVNSAGVRLSWPSQPQDRQYWVYRSTDVLGAYPNIGQRIAVVSSALSYLDTAADPAFVQNYAVAALNELGRGPESALSLTPLPGTVSSLAISAANYSGAMISLSWAPVTGAQTYEVSRATSSAAFAASWATVTANALTGTVFVDSAVSTNTAYYYQVRSQSLGFSTDNKAWGPVKAFDLPAAPTGFQGQGGAQRVDLAWDSPDAAQGVTGFALAVNFGATVLTLSSQTSAYSLTGLASAQGVTATLTALNSSGASSSVTILAQTNSVGPAPLPVSFAAKAGFYEASSAVVRVILSWSPVGTGQVALLYRSSAPIPLSLAAGGPASPLYLTGLAGSVLSATDTAVQANNPYYYALTALGPEGLPNAESLPVRLGPFVPFSYPGPAAMTVTAGQGRVDLQWSPPAYAGTDGLGAIPYRLYRYTTSSPLPFYPGSSPDVGFPIATTATSYADTQAQNGVSYQYALTLTDGAGREQDAAQTFTKVQPAGPAAAPDSVIAVPGDAQVGLRWLAYKTDTTVGLRFNVYRRKQGQDYGAPLPALNGVGPSSTLEYPGIITRTALTLRDSDLSLVNGTQYCYSLTELNEFGEGNKSQEACVTPFRPLKPALGALALTVTGTKDVHLTWAPDMVNIPGAGGYVSTFNLTGFRVYRSVDGGTSYSLIATTAAAVSTYTDNATQFGAAYVYRVVPMDDAGNEGYSYSLANVVIPAALNAVLLFRNSFNPAAGEQVPIQYSLLQPGHAWVRIYTLEGDYVATMFEEDVAQASQESPYLSQKKNWNGTNFDGKLVASGVYLIHLEAPGYRANARVAVIK